MQNNNNQLLQSLAQREINRLLAEDSNIESISIVGSVAYNLTDRYSDIDLLILYKEISDSQYDSWRKIAEPLNPVYIIGGKEHDFLTVGRFVEGIKIDFGRIKASKFQESVDAVVNDHSTDLNHPDYYILLCCLHRCLLAERTRFSNQLSAYIFLLSLAAGLLSKLSFFHTSGQEGEKL